MSVMSTCTNPRHDHTTTQSPDGAELAEAIPMVCNDCGQPAHYDTTIEWYAHDDPDAECWLIRAKTGGTPCTT